MEQHLYEIESEMERLIEGRFTAAPLLRHARMFMSEKRKEEIYFGYLTVLHYRMFGGTGDIVYKAAAAVELFILASDILDDIQDQDAESKAWMKVPMPLALNTASAMITLSQQALTECGGDPRTRTLLGDMMNRQLLQAANGQMLDLANDISDEEAYIEMIKQKSASLVVFACMAGVILAGRDWHPVVAEYAMEVGISAQIRNDLKDLLRWDDKSDFIHRKKTLLTLYLLEEVAEQDRWIADYFEGRISFEDIRDKRELLEEACERSGTLLYGAVMSRLHYNKFEELLDSLPESKVWKAEFIQFVS
ncbi:polyprenyl synthetase family protein [Paenibacillus thailandensis]|uniref:Polyprenyl synthetase family protein n=1 Tax=Paenibacillus thailandensis TaxID=393250 RepID=A0ABW5QV03_9BACL